MATYYVDPANGVNTGGNGLVPSGSGAYATINFAATDIPLNHTKGASGDIIESLPGTYTATEEINTTGWGAGSDDQPLTIRVSGGGILTIDCAGSFNHYETEAYRSWNSVRFINCSGAHCMRLGNNSGATKCITEGPPLASILSGVSNVLEQCLCKGSDRGIGINGSNSSIKQCYVHTTRDGITGGQTAMRVHRNIVVVDSLSTQAKGIFTGQANGDICHNTIYYPQSNAPGVGISTGNTNYDICNNMIIGEDTLASGITSAIVRTNKAIRNNVMWGVTTPFDANTRAHNIIAEGDSTVFPAAIPIKQEGSIPTDFTVGYDAVWAQLQAYFAPTAEVQGGAFQ